LRAGIPVNVPCTTINKVCSSGLKSVVYGAQSIGLGQSHTVVAGGFENMS
jgi:acetyl-CoA C-acetyltransferase